jgi:hypothetical protein
VRLFDFEHRLRPEYELLIAKIERGEMEAEHVPISALGSLAYTVHARRDDMGILTVEFFWGRGFPLKHTAFIYRSNGAWAQDPRLDWRATRLADNWFRASD